MYHCRWPSDGRLLDYLRVLQSLQHIDLLAKYILLLYFSGIFDLFILILVVNGIYLSPLAKQIALLLALRNWQLVALWRVFAVKRDHVW